MKSLVESILDSDFVDNINNQAEKYTLMISKTKTLEKFIRDYFEKLYKEKFINIREIRRKNYREESGNPGRDVLVKDDYSFNSWKSDYKSFKTKLIALSKKQDVTLDIVDCYLDYIEIYVNGFHDNGTFILATFHHIKPGSSFFIWRKSNPDNGGVKLSIYAIDRCKVN